MTSPDQRQPLTDAQRRMWSGQLLDPRAPLYNMAYAFTLRGALDPRRFERAFDRVLADCDAARTVIETTDGEPWQRVLDRPPIVLEQCDLRATDAPADAARTWLDERCSRPFALDRALIDAALLRLDETHWIWYLCQHHVVTDAESMRLLFGRVAAAYARADDEADGAGSPGTAPRFSEHVARSLAGTAQAERDTSHNAAPVTPVGASPRLYGTTTRVTRSASRRSVHPLGEARSAVIDALAARPEARALSVDQGRFHVFATALVACLARVSGQRRIAIGVLVHQRGAADRRTVGLFTDVLPMQVEVAQGETFLTLLPKVRDATAAVLRRAVGRPGVPAPRVEVHAVLNLLRGGFTDFAGLEVDADWLHPGHHDRQHPLRLHVLDFAQDGRLDLAFDRNDALLRGHDAVGHVLRTLDAMLDDPARAVATVDLLSEAERTRQLAFARDGVVAARGVEENALGGTVIDAFETQAARTPEAIAIRCGEARWTYGATVSRVHDVARRLGRAGIGPGMAVGIHMRRSPDALVALLAVLRAGACYVPLDPAWPYERRAFVARDVSLDLVLVRAGQEPAGLAVPELEVSIDQVRTSNGEEGPAVAPAPDRRAYVLYTSGSTGAPKGVVVEHRSLASYVSWARDHYGRTGAVTFPWFTPLTFDLTVTSIFVPLVSGATVVVYPETDARTDLALLDVLHDDAVDIVKLTPSHLALLDDLPPRRARIRQLIFGGEALTARAVRRAAQLLGDGDARQRALWVHNEYGPTEATVGCVVDSRRARRGLPGTVPIGRPIAGMAAFVLDEAGQLVPEGVIGELYVAGSGLARGYLEQPRSTAQAFVPHPFADGERLYRTGDRVRLVRVEDGDGDGELTLAYVGRRDDQVKIRGARVELGEVEALVAQHPAVAACAVTAVTPPAPQTPGDAGEAASCARCGLVDTTPDTEVGANGLCNHCRAFDGYETQVEQYFRSEGALRALLGAGTTGAGERDRGHDCLVLLSGGKDSTYMLCRLVDMGYRPLAFTLDNGYISEQAKDNIARVVEALGVDHVFGTTPAMNAVFVDSLERHANVCHGCFKVLYTLSIQLAREKDIPFVVTGLSRGQMFETRLTPELFVDLGYDADRIDDMVLEARKAYHRVDDAVSRLMDTRVFEDDRVFHTVQLVDFYRYVSVDLDSMLTYLAERVPWVRPTDTGRSTNCLINDVGIFVHKRERGFHNYAVPYAWDVRLGHKERDAARAELDDDIDTAGVARILDEIGYPLDASSLGRARLVAYVVWARDGGGAPPDVGTLHAELASRIPAHLLPSIVVPIEALPRTAHGKVDRRALPPPHRSASAPLGGERVSPRTPVERTLAGIWRQVLGVHTLGIRDGFVALGGDSIHAIRVAARARRLGLRCAPNAVLEAGTIERLATRCTVVGDGAADATATVAAAEALSGPVSLLPAQHWYFETEGADPAAWCHRLVTETVDTASIEVPTLEDALGTLVERHDALRLRFVQHGGDWRAETVAPVLPRRVTVDADGRSEADRLRAIEAAVESLTSAFRLDRPPLWGVVVVRVAGRVVALHWVAHHLLVDAVSWPVLLDELGSLLGHPRSASSDDRSRLSVRGWGAVLAEHARSETLAREREAWRERVASPVARLPRTVPATDVPGTAIGTIATVLEGEDARRALDVLPGKGRIRLAEVLAAALAEVLAAWTGARRVGFMVEGHGRSALDPVRDPSSTVGWLTGLYPLVLEVPPGSESRSGATLRAAKDGLRQPGRAGLGYGVLRYLHPDPAVRRAMVPVEPFEVVLNYLGRVRQRDVGLLGRTGPLALVRAATARRPFVLEVDVRATGDALHVDWTFTERLLGREAVAGQAQAFLDRLRALVGLALEDAGETVTTSDFPLAGLDQDGLGKLAQVLGRRGRTKPDR